MLKSKGRIAAFLVPLTTAVALLYHALAELQITVFRPETLLVVGAVLFAAAVAGLVAALGGPALRAVIFGLTAVIWVDMAFGLSVVFDELAPERRVVAARDRKRLRDLETISRALDQYIERVGPLPRPQSYGEGIGPSNFWQDWWDVSSEDTNGNGLQFLDFLVEKGLLDSVPVDPLNRLSPDRDPTHGAHYVYFVAPLGYQYRGGQCEANAGYSTYLLAVTDLETEHDRPPSRWDGSGCDCLWREAPDFFQHYFDYVTCGRFRP